MKIRTGPKLEKAIIVALSPLLLPVAAALIVAVGMMWCKRALIGPRKNWRRWFAWHPINVGNYFDTDWRWMEVIERRSSHPMGLVEYRAYSKSGGRDEN